LVESVCARKHIRHISHLTNIPTTNVLVKGGCAKNDILIGGAGDDALTGAGGRDIFDYGFKNAGNDTITDFTLGNTSINTNADTLNL
jgi:hypothetical protein